MSYLARGLLALVYLGLMGLAYYLSGPGLGGPAPVGAGDPDAVLAAYGFRLDEVAEAAGLSFSHQGPTFDAKLAHIMPQVASMGASLAVADYDGDGWADIYVANSGEGSLNALYRNLGDGRFRDVAAELGLADLNAPATGISTGPLWGDYDNDGDEDLFLNKWGRPELFRNDGPRGFTRVTETAGLPDWLNATAAVWFDYDRDGLLDLFIGGYYAENLDLWSLSTTRMMPESFEYAKNGGRSYLFRNLGDGRFTDVAEELGLVSTRWALAAAAADLRGSGWQDLVIANDYGVSEYFLNEGGRFREIGGQNGIGQRPKSGMNVAFGDVFNNGDTAIYITNISEEGNLVQGNNLWVPRRAARDGLPAYDNLAGVMGVELGGWSFGAQFGDLNNDGFQDLVLTNGYVSQNPRRSYWYDFSKIAGGNRLIIEDAAHWPPMEDMSLSGYQTKHLWLNDGGGRFMDVARAVGLTETYDGRAVALADFDNRGVLDLVLANQRGPLSLYRNEVAPGRHWIAFELEGTESNRSAIGAWVELHWAGMRQVQHLVSASGFGAQNQRRLHFGLGEAAAVERLTVHWPSGRTQELVAPAVDRVHRLVEPTGEAAP